MPKKETMKKNVFIYQKRHFWLKQFEVTYADYLVKLTLAFQLYDLATSIKLHIVPMITIQDYIKMLGLICLRVEKEKKKGKKKDKRSTSSKKSMHGEHVLALLNIVRTANSLSPTYLFKSSGPLIKTKS